MFTLLRTLPTLCSTLVAISAMPAWRAVSINSLWVSLSWRVRSSTRCSSSSLALCRALLTLLISAKLRTSRIASQIRISTSSVANTSR
ncbi:hypothetical protein D3C76_1369070 [compost metagenome]